MLFREPGLSVKRMSGFATIIGIVVSCASIVRGQTCADVYSIDSAALVRAVQKLKSLNEQNSISRDADTIGGLADMLWLNGREALELQGVEFSETGDRYRALIAEAIVSRLEHPSQKLVLKGGNYREKLQSTLPAGKKLEEGKLLN